MNWAVAGSLDDEQGAQSVHRARKRHTINTIYTVHRNSIMHTIYTRTIHTINTVQKAREPGQCTGLSRWKLLAPPTVYHPVSAPDASIENFCPGWQNNFPGCEVRGPVKTGFRLKKTWVEIFFGHLQENEFANWRRNKLSHLICTRHLWGYIYILDLQRCAFPILCFMYPLSPAQWFIFGWDFKLIDQTFSGFSLMACYFCELIKVFADFHQWFIIGWDFC